MATTAPSSGPVSTVEQRARRRRLQEFVHTLHAPGWEARLQPLAQHLTRARLVRSTGYPSAPVRHLDLAVLREALSRLLSEQWDDGCLIFQLIMQGQDPAVVAAGRGVSQPVLTEQLRAAVHGLAAVYEHTTAHASMSQSPRAQATTRLAGQREPSSG